MKRSLKIGQTIVSSAAALVLLVSVSGCAPRGETATLDQVLANSKAEYSAASRTAQVTSPETRQKLTETVDLLEKFAADDYRGDFAGDAERFSGLLETLTPSASYTVRPALTELTVQLRSMHADPRKVTAGERKLISARTLFALASELQTTSFSFQS